MAVTDIEAPYCPAGETGDVVDENDTDWQGHTTCDCGADVETIGVEGTGWRYIVRHQTPTQHAIAGGES
jgi:hypothetical protein